MCRKPRHETHGRSFFPMEVLFSIFTIWRNPPTTAEIEPEVYAVLRGIFSDIQVLVGAYSPGVSFKT